jgi:hypothetical protein
MRGSTLLLLFILLGALTATALVIPGQAVATAYSGLAGFPTSTTQVQDVIDTMDTHRLNIYRMSFAPAWSGSWRHAYRAEYVQYFLDHSSHTVVIDRNHLYPPTESEAATARSNWYTVRESIFQVLRTWPNDQRVAVELISEYVSSDFYSRMQSLVDDIRAAGYTNPIVISKWTQYWTTIHDPLDNTYQGYHFYFNTWSPSGAMNQIHIALAKGIKLLNTEVGADYRESRYFTWSTVHELNTFLSECADLGVGNCVWMNEDLDNWPRYQALGLDIPPASTPPPPPPDPSPPPPDSGIVLQDDFESGDLSRWTSTGTTSGDSVIVANYVPYQGRYHARFYTNGDAYGREDAYLTLNVNLPTATATGYFRFSSYLSRTILSDNDDRLYFIRFSSNWGHLAWAGVRRENGIDQWLLYADGAHTSSAIPLTVDRYYRVTLHWDSASRTAEMYVDDQKLVEAPISSSAAVTTVNMGIIYTYHVQNPLIVYGDDLSISTPSSASLFQDGFESGSLSRWTGTTTTTGETVTISNVHAHHGTYCACFTTTGSYSSREHACLRTSIDAEDVYVRGCFWIDSTVTTTRILDDLHDRLYLIGLANDVGSLALAGLRHEDGITQWLLYAGNTYRTSSAISIRTNQWYSLELHWNAAQRRAELFVDGTKILEIDATSGSSANVTYVDIGIRYTYSVQDPMRIYGDCIQVSRTYNGPE